MELATNLWVEGRAMAIGREILDKSRNSRGDQHATGIAAAYERLAAKDVALNASTAEHASSTVEDAAADVRALQEELAALRQEHAKLRQAIFEAAQVQRRL